MARRRSPHTPMSTNPSSSSSSSPSSDGFEDNIPRMAVSSQSNRNHDGPALSSSSSLFVTSIKRSWLRVNNQKWKKMALLVCFLVMMANLFLAIIKPGSRLLARGSTGNNLRAHHDHDAPTSKKNDALLNTESSSTSIQQNQELLQALYEIPIPTTHAELNSLNEEFIDLHPQFIVQWAHHHLHSTSSESPPPPSSSSSSSSSYQHNPSQSKLVQVTSFGPTGLVVLDLLYQSKLLGDVPVITMDTLHLFPESCDFYNTVRSHYKNLFEENDDSSTNGIIINGSSSGKEKKKNAMNLIITKPLHITYPSSMMGEGVISGTLNNRAQFETQYATTTLWKTNREKFTKLTKIDPLRKALSELGVEMWMTGRRRSSGGERASMDVLEFEEFEAMDRSSGGGGGGGGGSREDGNFDLRRGRWKLNPLAYWTYDQVWDYIRKHKLPYNVLYDKGYTSLGDTMTTGLPKSKPGTAADNNGLAAGNNGDAAVAVDAFERSGRFIGMGTNNECGLHSHIQKVKEQKQHALDAGEEFTAPTLPCDHCVELNLDNFEHHIANQGGVGGEVLVEFYSPYCGACQDFAPTLNRVANRLAEVDPLVQVARFDITEHEIPNVNGEELFKVDSTPTLYRVRYTPQFHVDLYEGQHDFKSIMRWLTLDPKVEAAVQSKVDMLGKREDKKWRRKRHRSVRKPGH